MITVPEYKFKRPNGTFGVYVYDDDGKLVETRTDLELVPFPIMDDSGNITGYKKDEEN